MRGGLEAGLAVGHVDDLLGQEEGQAVDRGLDAQVDEAEVEDARVKHGLLPRDRLGLVLSGLLVGDLLAEVLLLVLGQPAGVGGAVNQDEGADEAGDDGQEALDQEHPVDAVHAQQAVKLQQTAGQRVAEHVGDGQAHVEQTRGPGTARCRVPVGQVEHDAGEEAGLGDTQQEAEGVEAHRPLDEHEAGGDSAPADHDSGHPPPCTDPVHDEVRGDLEDGVTDEEERGAEGVGGSRDAVVGLPGMLGPTEVGAVNEGDDVHQQQERDEALGHLGQSGLNDGGLGCEARTQRGWWVMRDLLVTSDGMVGGRRREVAAGC